jgi:hypothetical protein
VTTNNRQFDDDPFAEIETNNKINSNVNNDNNSNNNNDDNNNSSLDWDFPEAHDIYGETAATGEEEFVHENKAFQTSTSTRKYSFVLFIYYLMFLFTINRLFFVLFI